MLDMFKNSATLFLQGRLFQDLSSVLRQLAIGIVIAVVLLVVLVKLGLSVGLAAIISAAITGAVQPYLFKDLKYA